MDQGSDWESQTGQAGLATSHVTDKSVQFKTFSAELGSALKQGMPDRAVWADAVTGGGIAAAPARGLAHRPRRQVAACACTPSRL